MKPQTANLVSFRKSCYCGTSDISLLPVAITERQSFQVVLKFPDKMRHIPKRIAALFLKVYNTTHLL